MSNELNIQRLERVNEDNLIQNLIAQANARYILLSTSENREDFPAYTFDDNNLSILAFYYLELGSSIAENGDIDSSIASIEKGASLLEYIHSAESNKSELSNYYCLASAMAYYLSFQYSKAYILIRKIETGTFLSKIIALFLQKNFSELNNLIDKICIDKVYSDEVIAENYSINEGADRIYEITIAKCLNGFVKYFQTGNKSLLTSSKTNLQYLKEIAEVNQEPSIWWTIRLLLLIAEGFNDASLWDSLGKYFDIKNPMIKKYIHSLVYIPQRGIHELFITQRKSLPKVLNPENRGCVITIPTSSGKTRIAEIAILDCINKNPKNKILYIAPFRSLAYEIENSLGKILENVGITLSHLYGGSLYSRLDEKIIEESKVIVATPEKAKAILRGNREISKQIKLIIIDEGHLLGATERLTVNEIFYEELRFYSENNGGKFLVLSAVLPNAEDLALWLTKSTETIYKDTWRPSDERLGILEWTGTNVNLNWMNNDEARPSFNNKFILGEQLPLKPRERRIKYFPGDKNEAIAATAFKLRNFGPALIFVGVKISVFNMANAYLKCLGINPEDYKWKNRYDWKAFELASTETYGENNNWLLFAKKGILCHHAGLHSDVRLPLERLMRNDRPLVIISTSTLGQGVNLGVSSVVFSTLYQGKNIITARDFWNIAGRAGRAFVDYEGKILVALDKSDISTRKSRRLINRHEKKIKDFFNKDEIDIASSGILALVRELSEVASDEGIQFDVLLQLIAENKTEEIGEHAMEIDDKLDWIDDTLLALQDLNNQSDATIDFGWIENFFRNSLAFIQTKNQQVLTEDNLIKFFQARINGIVKKVGVNKAKWRSIINSGIPLNSDLFLESKIPEIISALKLFGKSDKSISDKILLTNSILKIIDKMPVLVEKGNPIGNIKLNSIVAKWIKAEPLSSLNTIKGAEEIITNLFTFKLPWVFNGIAKKLMTKKLEDDSEVIEELSMLIEIGVPNLKALKIYQSGIRSRVSATELATHFEDELWNKSIRDYKNDILSNIEYYQSLVSPSCKEWIDLLLQLNRTRTQSVESIPNFTLKGVPPNVKSLIAKEINGKQHLVSNDLTYIEEIPISDIDFSSVNNVPGIFFKYKERTKSWKMVVENPYIIVN